MRTGDLEISSAQAPAAWDEAVRGLGGCPFHSRQWSLYSAAANRTEPIYFRLSNGAGKTDALAIGSVRTRRLGPLPLYKDLSFGSLPAAPGAESRERAIRSLIRYAATARFATVSFHSFGTPFASPALEEEGFNVKRRWEFIVDLPMSEEDLWQKLHGKKRNLIRKAQKAGLKIRRGDRFTDLLSYRSLALETRNRKSRQGIAFPEAADASHFRIMQERLIQPGLARLYLAEDGGNPVAGAVFACFHDSAYYMLSAASDEGLQRCGPDLLLWTAMTDCLKQGCRTFNLGGLSESELGGAALEESGLYHFKKRFSADVHECVKAERVLRPGVRRLEDLLQMAKKRLKSVRAGKG